MCASPFCRRKNENVLPCDDAGEYKEKFLRSYRRDGLLREHLEIDAERHLDGTHVPRVNLFAFEKKKSVPAHFSYVERIDGGEVRDVRCATARGGYGKMKRHTFTGTIMDMGRIYFDYAASTPVDPRVVRAMESYLTEIYGNPNSLHSFGQEAMQGVDGARTALAKAIGASAEEVIFTGSATEANNLALRGIVNGFLSATQSRSGRFARKSSAHSRARTGGKAIQPKLILSAIEHESVLDTAKDLERDGVEVVIVPVDKAGVVDLKNLERELDERTVLVSVMYGNNEIGTIQPIAEIAKLLRDFKNSKLQASNSKKTPSIKSKKRNTSAVSDFGRSDLFGICDLDFGFCATAGYPLLHVDAVQAFPYCSCSVFELGVDLMTLSAHKLYGPKGVGALYIKSNLKSKKSKLESTSIVPLVTGGGQEFGMRSGTQNTAGIAGFGEAVRLVEREREYERKRVRKIKNYFWRGLKKAVPNAELNGPAEDNALPHILNVYFPGTRAESMLIRLDMAGIAVSSGAACAARSAKPSHVLRAIGYTPERVAGSLRFSFGRPTTKEEIERALGIMKKLFE